MLSITITLELQLRFLGSAEVTREDFGSENEQKFETSLCKCFMSVCVGRRNA